MSVTSLILWLALPAAAQEPLALEPADIFGPVSYDEDDLAELGKAFTMQGVVGGEQAPPGRWDDAVGIVFYGQYVGCTGTLVAPDVVITAEHCVGGITHVIVGSKDWLQSDQGEEIIEVTGSYPYPGGWTSPTGYDIAVLTLAKKSTFPHRLIGTDCIIEDYLDDGVDVHVVGFGVTRADGGGFNSKLNEGVTVVQTAHCGDDYVNGVYTGCKPGLRPGGEIGAGGNGVDACFGDSGGPLYLPTPEGTFVIGVTSRAYLGVSQAYPCRDGGIYVRPDAVLDWIEEKAGRRIPTHNCNQPPEIHSDTIEAKTGEAGSIWLDVTDDGEGYTVELIEEPQHGTVTVHDGGEIVYVSDDGYVGDDSFVVAVKDDGHPFYERSRPQTVEHTVDVIVTKGGLLGCGCQTGGGLASAWLVGLVALLGLRRRR